MGFKIAFKGLAVGLALLTAINVLNSYPSHFQSVKKQVQSNLGISLESLGNSHCFLCHQPGNHLLNSFGKAYQKNKYQLKPILELDSDQDLYSNALELKSGTFPGNSKSFPQGVTPDLRSQSSESLGARVFAWFKRWGRKLKLIQ